MLNIPADSIDGDIMQLPLLSQTKGIYCLKSPIEENNNLWNLFDFYVLTINKMKSVSNIEQSVEILNALRVGKVKRNQLNVMKTRMLPEEGDLDLKNAVRIFPSRAHVDQFNYQMTSKLSRKVEIYHIKSKGYLNDFSNDSVSFIIYYQKMKTTEALITKSIESRVTLKKM